jgi:repressor LexA
LEKGQRQRERVYKFIRGFIHKYGYAPSYLEMQSALKIAKSHINYVLNQLEELELIHWSRGVSRGIVLAGGDPSLQGLTVPIVGTIEAGTGVAAPDSDFAIYDWEATVEFPQNLIPRNVKRDSICALRVEGYSMQEDGVLPGDLAIGQVTDRWNPRDMVAAWLVEDKLATLKRIEATGRSSVKLIPANPAFQPRIFERDQVLVQARIFAILRQF